MFVRGYRLFSAFAYGQAADSRQTQEDQAEPEDGVGAVAGFRDGFGSRCPSVLTGIAVSPTVPSTSVQPVTGMAFGGHIYSMPHSSATAV